MPKECCANIPIMLSPTQDIGEERNIADSGLVKKIRVRASCLSPNIVLDKRVLSTYNNTKKE